MVEPNGKYGIAQLSPWVLWPPDGLNLKQGTCGEWFGYGYLPLPLAKSKDQTEGKPVPTGDQCWTLFLNSGNFKGPVTFFLPYFWSKQAARDPRYIGHLLDTRPSNPNRALQMETQHIPSVQATDTNVCDIRTNRCHSVSSRHHWPIAFGTPDHFLQSASAMGFGASMVRWWSCRQWPRRFEGGSDS